jgi:transposase
MKFSLIMGVDMSKNWFHYCVKNQRFEILLEGEIVNQPKAIKKFIGELKKSLNLSDLSDLFLCLEHTGIYVKPLVNTWSESGGKLSIIDAVKVTKSLTGRSTYQEKTDHLDARRLAEYGLRFSDKLVTYKPRKAILDLIQSLQRQRSRLLKAKESLSKPAQESKGFDNEDISSQLNTMQAGTLEAIKKDLKQIDKLFFNLINEDVDLKKKYELMCSVEGIGPVIAREILLVTEGFTKFTPNQAKQFARYCGIVPLKKGSGVQVRKHDKIGTRGNRKVKQLLTMGVVSLLKGKGELKDYYNRKIGEGKKTFSVINAMRNKIILRVFAVVRNERKYVAHLNSKSEISV